MLDFKPHYVKRRKRRAAKFKARRNWLDDFHGTHIGSGKLYSMTKEWYSDDFKHWGGLPYERFAWGSIMKFLSSQVGRPWEEVFSTWRKKIPSRANWKKIYDWVKVDGRYNYTYGRRPKDEDFFIDSSGNLATRITTEFRGQGYTKSMIKWNLDHFRVKSIKGFHGYYQEPYPELENTDILKPIGKFYVSRISYKSRPFPEPLEVYIVPSGRCIPGRKDYGPKDGAYIGKRFERVHIGGLQNYSNSCRSGGKLPHWWGKDGRVEFFYMVRKSSLQNLIYE